MPGVGSSPSAGFFKSSPQIHLRKTKLAQDLQKSRSISEVGTRRKRSLCICQPGRASTPSDNSVEGQSPVCTVERLCCDILNGAVYAHDTSQFLSVSRWKKRQRTGLAGGLESSVFRLRAAFPLPLLASPGLRCADIQTSSGKLTLPADTQQPATTNLKIAVRLPICQKVLRTTM